MQLARSIDFETSWHALFEDYKFGDALSGWNARRVEKMAGYTHFIDYCCSKYPGSIVCDYRQRTKKFNDVDVLTNVISERAKLYHNAKKGCLSLPKENQFVIHLRLGDVIRSPNCFWESHMCLTDKVISSACWPKSTPLRSGSQL